MNYDFIATPRRTKEIMQRHGFTFKKSLGQNFMVDANILKRIIAAAQIDSTTGVIEIGPGIGSLTEQLAIHAGKVVAFEIDQRLLPILAETLARYPNVEIIHEDILKADVNDIIANRFTPNTAVKLVANLPYYITTPIIMNILQRQVPVESMTILLQKEVAERMAALPNTKAYGSLSIAVQYYTEARLILDVPQTAFMPQPNVISSVLQLERRKHSLVHVEDEEQFFAIVRASFMHRRKNLNNNLAASLKNKLTKAKLNQLLHEADIDGTRRGESLSIKEFADLGNVFFHSGITV